MLILLPLVSMQAQETSLQLTKKQMLEDFDFLYNKLERVNTRFEICKKVTGYDILNGVKEYRKYIDTLPTPTDFFDLMDKALISCKDLHISLAGGYPYQNVDTALIKEAKGISWKLFSQYDKDPKYSKRNTSVNPFSMYYVDGKYYTPDIYDMEENLQIPAGAQIMEINGMSIYDYDKNWLIPLNRNARYDHQRKRYYSKTLLSPQRTGQSDDFNLTYLYEGEVKEVEMKPHKMKFYKQSGHVAYRVDYYDKDELLYIRLPRMNDSKMDFYKEEIAKYKNKDIRKIVIDVRGNGGGSDLIWMEILASIIEKEMKSPQTICFRDNDVVKEYFSSIGEDRSDDNILDKRLIVGNDTLFCTRSTRDVKPSENTLGYTGKIYVLTDQSCFSSTLALIALSNQEDQLYTVGEYLGYFGGQGIMPFYFILPNSKMIFRIECSLDATGVKDGNWEDYYHYKTEIRVDWTLEETMQNYKYEGELYSEDYLYNIDPLFKKVLSLP